jgi:hypothetical protein
VIQPVVVYAKFAHRLCVNYVCNYA